MSHMQFPKLLPKLQLSEPAALHALPYIGMCHEGWGRASLDCPSQKRGPVNVHRDITTERLVWPNTKKYSYTLIGAALFGPGHWDAVIRTGQKSWNWCNDEFVRALSEAEAFMRLGNASAMLLLYQRLD